ncbi:MAG: hypothetical protein IPH11_05715 [Ignavibacteriales bacterium]|nr:hypothetical protein [Ignavibacteriales bacterium]
MLIGEITFSLFSAITETLTLPNFRFSIPCLSILVKCHVKELLTPFGRRPIIFSIKSWIGPQPVQPTKSARDQLPRV